MDPLRLCPSVMSHLRAQSWRGLQSDFTLMQSLWLCAENVLEGAKHKQEDQLGGSCRGGESV